MLIQFCEQFIFLRDNTENSQANLQLLLFFHENKLQKQKWKRLLQMKVDFKVCIPLKRRNEI